MSNDDVLFIFDRENRQDSDSLYSPNDLIRKY